MLRTQKVNYREEEKKSEDELLPRQKGSIQGL
jgi:hypothetical protein